MAILRAAHSIAPFLAKSKVWFFYSDVDLLHIHSEILIKISVFGTRNVRINQMFNTKIETLAFSKIGILHECLGS